MSIINHVCLWVVTGVIFVYGIGRIRQKKAVWGNENGNTQITRREFILLFTACVLMLFRCIAFGKIPGGINQDEAMAAVDALALSKYGTDRFGTFMPAHFQAWGFGQMSVLLSYLMVPFFKLWGMNAVTVRLPMLLVSLGGAAALYGLSKDIFGRKTAAVVLLFTAVNPWHFMQSRWALDCNVFPHMFIIGLYFLNRGLKNSRAVYLSMVFFALCMYSYGVAFYMVPVFLLVSCLFFLAGRYLNWKQVIGAAMVYFGISWPIYGVMLINFMKWETVKLPFVTMPFFPESIRSNDILFFSENPIRQLCSNWKALTDTVFLQKPSAVWNTIGDFGTMYLCTLPLAAAGAVFVFRQALRGEKRRKMGCRLLLIYWVTSVFTGLCINNVNVNRINIIFYGNLLFAAVAAAWLAGEGRVAAVSLFAIYGLMGILFLNRYFTVWGEQMEKEFYQDFLEAAEYAGTLQGDYYYITPDVQYEGYWYVSEILTQYAQQIDARYYQGLTDRFQGVEIPYAERYHFSNPAQEEIRCDINAVYVVRKDKISDYEGKGFFIRQFGCYYVVTAGN